MPEDMTYGIWIFEDYLDLVREAGIIYRLTGRYDHYDNYEADITPEEFEKYNELINQLEA